MTTEDNHSPDQRGIKRPASDISSPKAERPQEEEQDKTEAVEEAAVPLQEEEEIQNQSDATIGPYQCLPIHGEHKRAISCVSFAPTIPTASSYSNDQQVVCASACADGTVRLWDITHAIQEARREVLKSSRLMSPVGQISGHSRVINDLEWSPRTPNLLATACDDKTLRIWDVTRSRSSSVKDGLIQTVTTMGSDNIDADNCGSPTTANTVGQPSVGTGTVTNVINESLV
jgi:WD40 repeat protein